MRAPRLGHDKPILGLAVTSGLLALAAAVILLRPLRVDSWKATFLLAALAILWFALGKAVRDRDTRSLQTIENVIGALRQGDYSIRGREISRKRAHSRVIWELNQLAEMLQRKRLRDVESEALLRAIMTKIDIAIFTFDEEKRLRLANHAGERLLGRRLDELTNTSVIELGIEDWLTGPTARTIEGKFGEKQGRWALRRSVFWAEGRPWQLVIIADLRDALREEERQAWQRIVRVLGHELNNSVAPIQSIAESLQDTVRGQHRSLDWEEDLRRGLHVIGTRAASLKRFLEGYGGLVGLPTPRRQRFDLAALARRVAGIESRVAVRVEPGPPMQIDADEDQLEQALINLVRNGADAASETDGGVTLGWSSRNGCVEIVVTDDGAGLASTANLFVPFFTTKPGGSGIGLSISRQIAEAHGGTLTLENRLDRQGCVARLILPVSSFEP
jgi:PAS domain S-box-containing protein